MAEPSPESDLTARREAMRELYRWADDEVRQRWDRSLPLPEVLLDRWERAQSLGFGDGASLYNSALVYGDVRVGERAWIGPNVLLDGSGGTLSIGSFCSISAGVQVYTHDTVRWSLSGGIAERHVAEVSIGDRCHIGAGSVVAPGSAIGEACVVGAQSFVNGRVASRVVVAGTPARPIGVVRGEGGEVALDTSGDGRREAIERNDDWSKQ